jgi:hypothetical protein
MALNHGWQIKADTSSCHSYRDTGVYFWIVVRCLDSKSEGGKLGARKRLILLPLQSYQSWICSGISSASAIVAGEP